MSVNELTQVNSSKEMHVFTQAVRHALNTPNDDACITLTTLNVNLK